MKLSRNILLCIIFIPILTQTQEIDTKAYYRAGKTYILSYDYKNGIDKLNKVILADPEFTDAFYYRAQAYKALDSIELAIDDLNRYKNLSKKVKSEIYYNLSRLNNQLGNYQESIGSANIALATDKKFIPLYHEKIKAQIYLELYEEALTTSEKALDVKKSAENYYYKGQTLYLLGQYQRALGNFELALRSNMSFKEALIGKSKAYYELNQLTAALGTIDMALEIDEACKECYLIRSKINYKDVEYHEAVNDLSKVMLIYPDDPDVIDIWFLRGKYYAAQNKFVAGIIDFTNVINLNEEYYLAYYERGLLYEKSYQKKEAVKDYAKFLSLTSENLELKTQNEDANTRMYNLNLEKDIPIVKIIEPVERIEGVIDILKNVDQFQLEGIIDDVSGIKHLSINGKEIKPETSTSENIFTFSIDLSSKNLYNITINISDIYDNSGTYDYIIRRTEIDKPKIYIYQPYSPDDQTLIVEGTPTNIYIEGNIDDESPIKSILIDSIYDVSFRRNYINPNFYANIEIINKNSFELVVEDVFGNITKNFYYIERNKMDYSDNPMGRTWAFFIENSEYVTFDQLEGPAQDINKMKSILDAKYNFTTIKHYKNQTKDDLDRFFAITLRNLIDRHKINSILIWYAGHGSLIKDVGYWIPIDAKSNNEMSYYSLNTLKSSLEIYAKELTHLLVISDACQSGPTFYDALRSTNTQKSCNDALVVKSKSLQVLTSSDSYEQALDRSQFMEIFYEVLEDNDQSCISVDHIYKEVKSILAQEGYQTPQFGIIPGMGHQKGTFFFIKDE